jgi:5-methylcytosine-specific restriction endonuclease McrA
MNTNISFSPSVARQLVERLSSRLENEKRELVLFLIELAEFDANKIALELGYPSTLGCLMTELRLSESSACRRISAARMLARFPQIGGYILSSRLTLMSLVALKDVLDETNVGELLDRASGLSEPAVRQLVLRMRLGDPAVATPVASTVAADAVATTAAATENAPPRDDLQAMTLWVGREFREELEAVRTLLGHAVPSGKLEEVLLHVLRAQRKVLERRRYGSTKPAKTTTATPPAASSAHADNIPAAMRREVYEREGGTCAYIGDRHRRCGSKLRLEYQHIVPVARGGRSTLENVTLYCRAHNLLQAENDFGAEHVRRKQLQRSATDSLVRLGYPRIPATAGRTRRRDRH